MPSSVLRGDCWIRYQNDFEFEDLTSLYHLSSICLVENKEQLRELNNVYLMVLNNMFCGGWSP